MQIQLNTDHNIEGKEALAAHVTEVIEKSLRRFGDQITRVEVHLADENGAKAGQDDKRCMIEVRMEHRQPLAVTHHAGSVHQAIDGAAGKVMRAIEHLVGRTETH